MPTPSVEPELTRHAAGPRKLPGMMRRSPARRFQAVLSAAVIALLVLPSIVVAHAELETSTPKDGATVEGTPSEVAGTYSEGMDPAGSSLKLLDADGTQVAEGGVDPADDKRMAITDLPELVPGTYTVKSTTKSAVDGDVDRKEWSFTVAVAPTTSPSPTPTPTAAPSATPAPSPTPAAPSPSPVASATPTPSADGGTTGSGGDVLLPILVAVIIVAVIAGYLFSRRDRTPTQP
jgi:methionine-rich copper-binding protein CopC